MKHPVKIQLEPLGQTIEVERGTPLRDVLHLYGVEFPCGGQARCKGCRIKCVAGSLPPTSEQADILTAEEIASGWRLACSCTAESNVTLQIGQWEMVILAEDSGFEFTPRHGLGIAVDLGTTTMVAQLLDLESGRVLGVRTAINPHTAHGSDVMSRIETAMRAEPPSKLTTELRAGVGALVSGLLASRETLRSRLHTVVIAGNTVMHHLFCGIDVEPLSHWPFATTATGPQRFRAGELGWNLERDPVVRFLPCLGSFVGSDILCGILATKMHESAAPMILVDLGTNGEIVVGNRERMLCASAAAGPAFEGGRIQMGMRATTGAISEVTVEAGRLRCRVLGNETPRGICGSGLVDAVAAGLELGLILPSGRLARPGKPIELAPPVTLVQNDIRQLQLAKAAIAAGTQILRRRFGDQACAAVPVYLAGAFGNYVRHASAQRIGMLDVAPELALPAGNTALLGAKIALFSDDAEDEFREIRRRVEHVSLAADENFQETYLAATAFPD